MANNRECHAIAARMLVPAGDLPDPECLHPQLAACLTEVDDCCRRDGGHLHSRQVIAMICWTWGNTEPTRVSAYSDANRRPR